MSGSWSWKKNRQFWCCKIVWRFSVCTNLYNSKKCCSYFCSKVQFWPMNLGVHKLIFDGIYNNCSTSWLYESALNSDHLSSLPQNHQGVCPQESVYCENKCGARMMRRLLSQHSMAECPKRTQPCKYCGKEFVFDTIQVSLMQSLPKQTKCTETYFTRFMTSLVLWQLDVSVSCCSTIWALMWEHLPLYTSGQRLRTQCLSLPHILGQDVICHCSSISISIFSMNCFIINS